MKFGLIGFGSMGKRRARDLGADGHELLVFDVRTDRLEEATRDFGFETRGDLESLLSEDADALVISTPPDTHEALMKGAFAAGRSFFVEANIAVPSPSWVTQQERRAGVIAVPSATWRFHPLARDLRERCRASSALSVHHHYASYLPDWHPWERYDEFYAGRELSTCAAREMVPFELDLLTWLFGPVASVGADRRRARVWRTDIVDTYLLKLDFAAGVYATLVVELHQRATVRTTRVGFADRALVLDAAAGQLCDVSGAGGSVLQSTGTAWESIYREEMRCFVSALTGSGEYPKTWEEERHLYDVLAAAELSARTGAAVEVDTVATSERDEDQTR